MISFYPLKFSSSFIERKKRKEKMWGLGWFGCTAVTLVVVYVVEVVCLTMRLGQSPSTVLRAVARGLSVAFMYVGVGAGWTSLQLVRLAEFVDLGIFADALRNLVTAAIDVVMSWTYLRVGYRKVADVLRNHRRVSIAVASFVVIAVVSVVIECLRCAWYGLDECNTWRVVLVFMLCCIVTLVAELYIMYRRKAAVAPVVAMPEGMFEDPEPAAVPGDAAATDADSAARLAAGESAPALTDEKPATSGFAEH